MKEALQKILPALVFLLGALLNPAFGVEVTDERSACNPPAHDFEVVVRGHGESGDAAMQDFDAKLAGACEQAGGIVANADYGAEMTLSCSLGFNPYTEDGQGVVFTWKAFCNRTAPRKTPAPPAQPAEDIEKISDFSVTGIGTALDQAGALSAAIGDARGKCVVDRASGLVNYDKFRVQTAISRDGSPTVTITGYCKLPSSVRPNTGVHFTTEAEGVGRTREDALKKAEQEGATSCQTGHAMGIVGKFGPAGMVGYDHDVVKYSQVDPSTVIATISLVRCAYFLNTPLAKLEDATDPKSAELALNDAPAEAPGQRPSRARSTQ